MHICINIVFMSFFSIVSIMKQYCYAVKYQWDPEVMLQIGVKIVFCTIDYDIDKSLHISFH